MRSDSIIKYDFLGSWRSTIKESIRVGFTTTDQKGFLLGFTSNITGEYLSILVSNSGALKVVFDFGFERQEITFPGIHFGLGQFHDVRFSRKDSGSTVVLQVSFKNHLLVLLIFIIIIRFRSIITNQKNIISTSKTLLMLSSIIFSTCILVRTRVCTMASLDVCHVLSLMTFIL